jgi:hypothetical protein
MIALRRHWADFKKLGASTRYGGSSENEYSASGPGRNGLSLDYRSVGPNGSYRSEALTLNWGVFFAPDLCGIGY